jgi:D-aspartate ligase
MRTQPRNDIRPVILAGDMSSYPLAREFHEAFGTKSTCIVPEPIKIIETSSIVDVHRVPTMGADDLRDAICAISAEDPSKTVVLIANSDAVVERVEGISHDLPSNVRCSLPPHDPMVEASNKITFARMCERYGLDAPRSEVVHLAGTDPIGPTSIPFPLVAKPAESSAEYFLLYAKGFKKVYCIRSQAELDELWAALRAEGYSGDFLVQELIGGDDTYVDMITCYVNQRGKVTMFVSAQVLLEDHNPMLLGNPVAMITRPMPELWEKVGRMLGDIGWRGFANFDMKRDPETGRVLFMDFNPRIGANSYYACVGGVNPMRALVADFVDGTDEVMRIDRKGLYSRARPSLVRRYLTDPKLLAEFDEIVRGGNVADPMRYKGDSLASRSIGRLMELNYDRKFAKYYPVPTPDAF